MSCCHCCGGPLGGLVQAPLQGPSFTGFGQIRFADTNVDPEDYFAAGVRQQLRFVPDPNQTQDFLKPPFKDHVAWTNHRIVARPGGFGDFLWIIVNLLVVSQTAGGEIICDLDVGTANPTFTDGYSLKKGAGAPERATFVLATQVLDNVLANGVRIYLTGTTSFTVSSEAVICLPQSLGPGA